MGQSQEKLDYYNNILHNGVHELHEYILDEFSKESIGIKENFEEAVSSPAIDVIRSIAEMDDIPTGDRRKALMRIYNAMCEAMEEVEKTSLSKVFWKDRGAENRRMSPCEFVVENYPSYGDDLTQADVRKFDPSLYQALHNWKRRTGWPDSFLLPTKSESISQELSALPKPPSTAGMKNATPLERAKTESRAASARYRKRKGIS